MAAKTTVKVAVTNNAAKDDYYGDLDWMAEDHELAGYLNVLGNDPGSAKLIGVSQNPPAGAGDLVNGGSTFVPTGFTGALVVTIANGQLAIDATALNGDLQSLGEGETASITFYYTAQMANGAYSTAKVTIDIAGENDDPEIDGASVLSAAIDDTADDDSYDSVGGQIVATDVDANDAGLLTYDLADGEDGLSDYGTFTLNADGSWTFVADDAAVEGLKTTVVETFDVVVEDGHGGSATTTITVTLNGVNDTAEITGDDAAEVTEDGGSYLVAGSLSVSDRDVGDAVFQAVAAAALIGSYGTFTFDETSGAWTYELDNDNPLVQALNDGDTVYDYLEVASADGTTKTITVAIHGDDDAPAYTSPPVYTGTGDPNDNDGLGSALGQNLSSTATTGPDTLYGGGGDDAINGGNGGDTLYGGSGDDQLGGGNQGDTLYGGSGTDTITGGNDDDIIIGGYGADILTGNGGNDTFRYLSALDTGDSITDFATGDKIDLSAFATSIFVGLLTAPGDVGPNEVGYMINGGVTTIYVDTDGIAGADLEIYLTNGHTPVGGDFIF